MSAAEEYALGDGAGLDLLDAVTDNARTLDGAADLAFTPGSASWNSGRATPLARSSTWSGRVGSR